MHSRSTIRPYQSSDEVSWLRCRLLGLFETDYYDDVWRTRPTYEGPSVQLVAEEGGEIVGILDLEVDGQLATIETVVIHPNARGRGIAGMLLEEALDRLPPTVELLDAWTREDPAASAWYRASGFTEQDRYLHVYKNWDESDDGFATPEGLTNPIKAFMHAGIDQEVGLRERFRRVHVCRRFVRQLS